MLFIFAPLWLFLALATPVLADFNCQGGSFISTTVLDKTLDKVIVLDSDLQVLSVLSAVSKENFPRILWSKL